MSNSVNKSERKKKQMTTKTGDDSDAMTDLKLRMHLYSCEQEAKSFCVLLLVYFKAEARN